MGNLDQLMKLLFQEQGLKEFNFCVHLLFTEYDYCFEESLMDGGSDLDLWIVALGSFFFFFMAAAGALFTL